MKNENVTKELSEFIVNTRFEDFSKEAVDFSKRCFLDWIGVTIGGMKDPSVAILVDLMAETGGEKQASVIGHGMGTSVLNAALVNGTMSHNLDYDDAHMSTRSHPSAPLIAALLPISENRKSRGSDLITAFILGCDVGIRIGLALGKAYYDHGWHATPILGRFGAAAGVGKLLGLDAEKINHTFGLAASQAGGIRKAFGTMTKPFHAGKAAMDGMLSAMLAGRGFTATLDILDANSGFLRMLSPQCDPDQILNGLGKQYHLFDISFKPYAACLAIHPPLVGLISIGREHRIDPETIDHIDLEVAPICLLLGDKAEPKTGREGKFSVYYCAALAMTEGQAGESLFNSDLVNARHIRRLIKRTKAKENKSFKESEAVVAVVLKDGNRFTKHVTSPKGDPGNPLSFDEIVEKFSDLTRGLLPGRHIEQIVSMVLDLDRQENILALLKMCSVDNHRAAESSENI